jgi:sacsin
LRPFSEIFYNDIGENHLLVNGDGHFIAHQSLDESLVMELGLNRLGLSYANLRNVGPNMGQAPITTVRRTLQQCTNQQFLLEFLANAEDAQATEFRVAVNQTIVSDEQNLRVLSPAMVYLCRLPSLVVHNNAQFTSQDFEGICKTSVGGKLGRPDTIGEFGLGVLTMYHFTDVCCDFSSSFDAILIYLQLAMIISGSHVLFLDPSKTHLPLPDRASLILELQCIQRSVVISFAYHSPHPSCQIL